MPLYSHAKALIEENLRAIEAGEKVRSVAIGMLSETQLEAINAQRQEDDLPAIVAEILFVGGHVYKSRVLKDGYQISDIIDEIESSLSERSVVIYTPYMTAMQNPVPRTDRLGNRVNDRAIFECTKYRPNPELFSTQPKGDRIKPVRK